MNKICGYSCEHNKGGLCQITNCDKKTIMTTTTEPQVLTRWQDRTIEDLKHEINKLTAESTEWESKCYKQKEVLDKIKENCKNNINRYEDYIGKEDIVRESKFILELLEEIE